MGIDLTVLRVFTDSAGNFGNPLGVVDAGAVPPPQRQQIATQLGYSETIFIDLPEPGAATASARIFTPATELPFAGHPTVGAAWFLSSRGTPVNTLRVPAGIVQVTYDGDLTAVNARSEWAPEFAIHDLGRLTKSRPRTPTTTPTTSNTICGHGRTSRPAKSVRGCSHPTSESARTRRPGPRRFG